MLVSTSDLCLDSFFIRRCQNYSIISSLVGVLLWRSTFLYPLVTALFLCPFLYLNNTMSVWLSLAQFEMRHLKREILLVYIFLSLLKTDQKTSYLLKSVSWLKTTTPLLRNQLNINLYFSMSLNISWVEYYHCRYFQ